VVSIFGVLIGSRQSGGRNEGRGPAPPLIFRPAVTQAAAMRGAG
jgi:hypothetical protein